MPTTSVLLTADGATDTLEIRRRSFGTISWVAQPTLLVMAACLYLLAGEIVSPWPWVISLFIAGMPHGAYDIFVIRKQARSRTSRYAVISIYLLVMLLSFAAFTVSPVVYLMAFFALSAHHFGISDSVATRGLTSRSLRQHIVGLCHGILVLAPSFAFQPDKAWQPFIEITRAFGTTIADFPASQITGLIASVWLVIAASILVIAYTSRTFSTRVRLEQLCIAVAALLLGATTDPLFAVGAYFLCVHAPGHCLRASLPNMEPRTLSWSNALRVHTESVVWLIPSIAAVGIGAVIFMGGLTPNSLALSFILFCAVATLPHHLLWLGVLFQGSNRRGQ